MKLKSHDKAATSWLRWRPGKRFPRPCLTCGEKGSRPLCNSCLAELETLELGCGRCGNPQIHEHAEQCPWCERLRHLPEQIHCAFAYRNRGRDMYRWVKYHGYWRLLPYLCHEWLEGWKPFYRNWDQPVLVPVPESLGRQWRRSFNPAEQIARILGESTQVPVRGSLKMRWFQSSMVGLGYEDRRKNARNRFKAAARALPKSVVLVDDVLTTGATLEAATVALKRAGVKQVGWVTLFRTL